MRILVIEDDRMVASFIQTGLGQEGYAVDVLHVAQRHGGDISVRSRPGKGSTFTVTLQIIKRNYCPVHLRLRR